jgi:hypothetical protein
MDPVRIRKYLCREFEIDSSKKSVKNCYHITKMAEIMCFWENNVQNCVFACKKKHFKVVEIMHKK